MESRSSALPLRSISSELGVSTATRSLVELGNLARKFICGPIGNGITAPVCDESSSSLFVRRLRLVDHVVTLPSRDEQNIASGPYVQRRSPEYLQLQPRRVGFQGQNRMRQQRTPKHLRPIKRTVWAIRFRFDLVSFCWRTGTKPAQTIRS